jgi:hypothetical protein
MLIFHADAFVSTAQLIERIRGVMKRMDGVAMIAKTSPQHEKDQQEMQSEMTQIMNEVIPATIEMCEGVPLSFTLVELKRLRSKLIDRKQLPTKYELEALSIRITDELSSRHFFSLPERHWEYFEPAAPLFGTVFETKFPSAQFELDEAAKCLALERSTAAVFHLMRLMEIGVKATSVCLGLPAPIKDGDRSWGGMLRKFKEEIERRDKASPPQWLPNDKAFFADAYASLDAVRNVWRNATMHVDSKYTEEEADHIFAAVRGFMKKIALRLDEAGTPAA